MKKALLLFFSFCVLGLQAQVIFDFESAATSTSFQTFGGAFEGQINSPIANPDQSGINTSDSVMIYMKAGDAPTWGGAFANPGPAGGIDVTNGGLICVDVWMDHIGIWSIKLENASDDPDNYRQEIANTIVNGWERLCFSMDSNSLEGNMTPATGKTFTGFVIFPDFGSDGGGTDVTYYFDNVTKENTAPMLTCDTIIDFENTTQTFTYFGSTLDGQNVPIIENPVKAGLNTSDSILLYVKAAGAQTWAGAWSNPEVPGGVDANFVREVCVKVLYMQPGNFTLKLELPDFADPENWINTQDVTTVGEWTQVCLDLTENSFEGNMTPAVGKIFPKIVMFPDFGNPGDTADVNYYIDEFVTKSISTAQNFDVTFSLNMNEYEGTYTQPYVSGSFNGWSEDANPMEDPESDGIWTATINISAGESEYKFQLDKWATQEEFDGSDVCTKESGGYVNRVLIVTADDTLQTVCYNSCYDCGASVNITWNLDMSGITIAPEGVFVAGGPFFGHGLLPPMTDMDGDSIYTFSLEREIGFQSDYTFINGLCLPDWNCKEDISGQDCAVPPFNDRTVGPVTEDLTINTFFGSCEEFSSTRDLEFDNSIVQVYPSIATESVFVEITDGSPDYRLNLYDVNGKFAIVDQEINLISNRIDVTDLAPGMYFIQVSNERKIAIKRVIIQ